MALAQQVFEPYTMTLQALAQRWSLSVEGLRKRFHAGHLDGFQEGRSIRIFMSEVRRVECLKNTKSCSTEGPTPSLSENLGFELRLGQMTSA